MMIVEEKDRANLILAAVGSLTLGLAPFFPEPHLFGKIRWIMGGGDGMQIMDYLDLAMHGAPWIFLVFMLGKIILKNQIKDGNKTII